MDPIDTMRINFAKIGLDVSGLNYSGSFYCIHLGGDENFARKLQAEIQKLSNERYAGRARQEDDYGLWQVTGETKYAPIVWEAAYNALGGRKYTEN